MKTYLPLCQHHTTRQAKLGLTFCVDCGARFGVAYRKHGGDAVSERALRRQRKEERERIERMVRAHARMFDGK